MNGYLAENMRWLRYMFGNTQATMLWRIPDTSRSTQRRLEKGMMPRNRKLLDAIVNEFSPCCGLKFGVKELLTENLEENWLKLGSQEQH